MGRLFAFRGCFKAAAFVFPLVRVVLLMRHDFENEYFLAGIQNASDQPVLVASDVEDDTVANEAGAAKLLPDISPGLPRPQCSNLPACADTSNSSTRRLGRKWHVLAGFGRFAGKHQDSVGVSST